MLKKRSIKKPEVCFTIMIVLLCGFVGLVIVFKNAGSVPPNQFNKTLPSVSQAVSAQPLLDKVGNDDVVSQREVIKDQTGQGKCSGVCRSTLSILDKNVAVDDEAYRNLKRSSKTVASFLQKNDRKRQHYLQVALTTTDDDKRSFLTDVFKYLPDEQKQEIGRSLINSEGWHARAQGVTLITGDGVSDLNTAKTLTDTLSSENNAYVKGTILRHLKHSEILQGDANVLNQLDLILNSDVDETSTRIEALKAKLELSEQPYLIIPDAVQALHAVEPELQLTGLMMVDKILQKEEEYVESGVYIDKKSIKGVIKNLRDMSLEGVDDHNLEGLIEEAGAMYQRHFGS